MDGCGKVGRASRYEERHLSRLRRGREEARNQISVRGLCVNLKAMGGVLTSQFQVVIHTPTAFIHLQTFSGTKLRSYCFSFYNTWQRALCTEGAQ